MCYKSDLYVWRWILKWRTMVVVGVFGGVGMRLESWNCETQQTRFVCIPHWAAVTEFRGDLNTAMRTVCVPTFPHHVWASSCWDRRLLVSSGHGGHLNGWSDTVEKGKRSHPEVRGFLPSGIRSASLRTSTWKVMKSSQNEQIWRGWEGRGRMVHDRGAWAAISVAGVTAARVGVQQVLHLIVQEEEVDCDVEGVSEQEIKEENGKTRRKLITAAVMKMILMERSRQQGKHSFKNQSSQLISTMLGLNHSLYSLVH